MREQSAHELMKYRKIKGTNLDVSEVGFGVWSIAHKESSGDRKQDSTHLIRYALDRGINFFETADVFGFGRGEELLGEALLEDRDRVVLATRVGYDPKQFYFSKRRKRQAGLNFSPKYVRSACEASLKRLKTDHIDLYQINHPDVSHVERDDLYLTLEKLKRQGKITAWGACLVSDGEWLEEAKLILRLRQAQILQISSHLFDAEAGKAIIEDAERHCASLVAELSDEAALLRWLSRSDGLSFLCEKNKRTALQALMKFSLASSQVASVLVDMDHEEKINEVSKISECPDLSVEELGRVEEFYTHWEQAQENQALAQLEFFHGDE